MKFKIKSILFLGIIGIIGLGSCKKEKNVSLETNIAQIPVTVSDVIGYYTTPTVQTTKAAGTVKIVLNIPQNSGRTIKEITRVAASASVNGVQVTTGLYNTAPIPGSGTSATFTTTLTEYAAKVGPVIAPTLPIPATAGTASSFLPRNFFFMITLDNGDVIFTTNVRVYIAS